MNARRERIATAIFAPRVVRMHQAAPPTQSAPSATNSVKQEAAGTSCEW